MPFALMAHVSTEDYPATIFEVGTLPDSTSCKAGATRCLDKHAVFPLCWGNVCAVTALCETILVVWQQLDTMFEGWQPLRDGPVGQTWCGRQSPQVWSSRQLHGPGGSCLGSSAAPKGLLTHSESAAACFLGLQCQAAL